MPEANASDADLINSMQDAIPTPERIKNFISSLKLDEVFFTRDCLNFGQRNAVDQCLSRMVRGGDILRLAFGCFMKNRVGAKVPSKDEIAIGKAKAFGRTLYSRGIKALKEFADFQEPKTRTSFATDGDNSSFTSVRGIVHLKRYAPRKLMLKDSVTGLLIRALWEFRSPAFATELWAVLKDFLGRSEKAALWNSCHIMPAWLVDIVKYQKIYEDHLSLEQAAIIASLNHRVRRKPDDGIETPFDPREKRGDFANIDVSKYENEFDEALE
jgi:hypothetical protein